MYQLESSQCIFYWVPYFMVSAQLSKSCQIKNCSQATLWIITIRKQFFNFCTQVVAGRLSYVVLFLPDVFACK